MDYDSPRRPPTGDDGMDELQARDRTARPPTADLDEVDTADGVEPPDADMSGEELTVPVSPMRSDELQCPRCFLVHHRSQFVLRADGLNVCRECS
ncbi:DUF4193 family protein [Virgisporangium ochraceum]|uniref:DUF4193 family protein n=1 Tax=Virgisporangium ochraceum TaxID=65505 RepID=UPI0023B2A6B3|nr:DUF4193 family protein [Virgisporangium ochraceum]